jgi:RNA polymerase sigma factor (sigma-70 family)
MTANADDQALIEGLRRGDDAAWSEAIRRHAGMMHRTAAAIAGPEAADDILQECWISVVRKIETFEGRSRLSTWLVSIVANRARSHLRTTGREQQRRHNPRDDQTVEDLFDQNGRWKTPVSDWGRDMPQGLLESDELRNCLEKHIDILPPQQREALVLREIDELSHDEICEVLSVSPANARVLLHRARLRLMQMVDGFKETGEC